MSFIYPMDLALKFWDYGFLSIERKTLWQVLLTCHIFQFHICASPRTFWLYLYINKWSSKPSRLSTFKDFSLIQVHELQVSCHSQYLLGILITIFKCYLDRVSYFVRHSLVFTNMVYYFVKNTTTTTPDFLGNLQINLFINFMEVF